MALLRSGTDEQKERAVEALRNLAINDDNKAAIVAAGAIEVLLAFVQSGTQGQTEGAVEALEFFAENDGNAEEEDIENILFLMRSGTDEQKELAAGVLGSLARDHDKKEAIAATGGIEALVALVRSGTDHPDGQKDQAAWALAVLAENDDNKVAIAAAGVIEVLVALAQSGTDGQKEHAAVALRNLAVNADNEATIRAAGFTL